MNKTTKAKYDLATRMLKVDISVDEVALMSGLTIDEIEKLRPALSRKRSLIRQLSRRKL